MYSYSSDAIFSCTKFYSLVAPSTKMVFIGPTKIEAVVLREVPGSLYEI